MSSKSTPATLYQHNAEKIVKVDPQELPEVFEGGRPDLGKCFPLGTIELAQSENNTPAPTPDKSKDTKPTPIPGELEYTKTPPLGDAMGRFENRDEHLTIHFASKDNGSQEIAT
ncbi:hypothetical protein V565_244700, partial [Rhizoctonia solani 123E]